MENAVKEGSFEDSEAYRQWQRSRLIIGMTKGDYPSDSAIEGIDWMDDVYQVVCSQSFESGIVRPYSLGELIFFGIHESSISFEFDEDSFRVLVLKGRAAVERLEIFIDHYLTTPPQPNSPMDSFFFTCGSVVDSPARVCESYRMAAALIKRRFFAARNVHMLNAFDAVKESAAYFGDVPDFGRRILEGIQTFSRSLVSQRVGELYSWLCESGKTEQQVRQFLLEMSFSCIEEIRRKYPELKDGEIDSRRIIKNIMNMDYLHQIMDYVEQVMEKVMTLIDGGGRTGHINDILYYIQHNLGEPLRLEKIALLFGYNSAYLGKIFRENVGESFNSYLDRMRIEKAKELLKQEKLKVYEIAEMVGYKNVDYFHIKFLKFENVSPAVYRKNYLKEHGAK